MIERNLQVSGD